MGCRVHVHVQTVETADSLLQCLVCGLSQTRTELGDFAQQLELEVVQVRGGGERLERVGFQPEAVKLLVHVQQQVLQVQQLVLTTGSAAGGSAQLQAVLHPVCGSARCGGHIAAGSHLSRPPPGCRVISSSIPSTSFRCRVALRICCSSSAAAAPPAPAPSMACAVGPRYSGQEHRV
eukprot:SAG22_NODE_1267_length_4952_cov_3.730476_4_plen_177_part_00